MKETKHKGGRPSKRRFILEQAEKLVQEKGAAHLTFDHLTEVTGISKGGLLYHFDSKEALIIAMLERYIERREERTLTLLPKYKNEEDAEIKARVESEMHEQDAMLSVDSAILAAAALNPGLLEPLQGRYEELCNKFKASKVGGSRARLVWLSVIGHRLMRQFGLLEETQKEHDALIKLMMDLLDVNVNLVEQSERSDNSVFG